MKITTVIFDMDGLLIDSEPLWFEAANEAFGKFDISISPEDYVTTTGLRTKEFLEHWLRVFKMDSSLISMLEADIKRIVIEKVLTKAEMMPGAIQAIELVKSMNLKIGLASSSPQSLIDAMITRTRLHNVFSVTTSAEHMSFGKPHPMVFMECAIDLNSRPEECICLEDSFNGMIAAKASKMKCIVVPHPEQFNQQRWHAADLKLNSLHDLKEEHFFF